MHKDLNIIMELMEELKDKMQYGEDDFSERLGRKKPGLEVAKISIGEPEMGEEMGMESDESPSMDDMEGGFEDEMEGPEEKFKNRLMRMRG